MPTGSRSPGRPPKQPTTPNRSSRPVKREGSATPTRMSARLAAQIKDEKDSVTVSHQERSEKSVQDIEPKSKKQKHNSSPSEFGGAFGTFCMMFFLPTTVFYINMACSKDECTIMKMPPCTAKWSAFFDLEATLIFLGWFAFQALLYILPTGRVVQGPRIIIGNHKSLSYRVNGFFAYVVSLAGLAVAVYMKVPVTIVYDKFLQLATTAAVFAFALAVFVYIKARLGPSSNLSPAGNTGSIVYDFFMGHELNPRIGSFDIKFFCEMRPGLIGWTMLNIIFVLKDYEVHGVVNPSLAFVVFFQALYVADALWFEEAILTTMDIIYEGFGFMLSFGDLAWVPFLYTLQARYLLEHPLYLPWYCLVPIVILNAVGYFIFRGSNSQKNDFRTNPNNPALAHLETIPTSVGKRLLVSGWWGLCRKPNYLGDILMAIAWSLPCGFHSILPYFYPIYFFILLAHRERRDGHMCKAKYGAAWDKYCERVRYRIIPGIY
ncbi:delta(14)-sterol reductase TM7SF2-like isoform X2 [Dreissena polymorpha]|nr:delta(14)-sterol reductase TM7SF2-like isoform X2 [Dreissena polymorpha]